MKLGIKTIFNLFQLKICFLSIFDFLTFVLLETEKKFNKVFMKKFKLFIIIIILLLFIFVITQRYRKYAQAHYIFETHILFHILFPELNTFSDWYLYKWPTFQFL